MMRRRMTTFAWVGALALTISAANAQQADAGLLDGLFGWMGGGSSCHQPAHHSCCAPAPVRCAPAPVRCAPAPVCCAPAPVCCTPVQRDCSGSGSGHDHDGHPHSDTPDPNLKDPKKAGGAEEAPPAPAAPGPPAADKAAA